MSKRGRHHFRMSGGKFVGSDDPYRATAMFRDYLSKFTNKRDARQYWARADVFGFRRGIEMLGQHGCELVELMYETFYEVVGDRDG